MAVDADTKKFLEEVKKGKPRRFVMICKGVKILSLIVYKKGTLDKYKKQAKAEGKGQFYHGVVDGKGVNIAFKLAASDGYDSPPGKELILKDFLASEAEMKFKPTYEIVAELPEVDESDTEETESANAPEASAPAEPAEAAPTSSASPTDDPAARAAKLAEALKKLKPLVDKVINDAPNRKGELHATMVQIAGEIKGQEFDKAKQNLVDFATLLKSLAAQPPAPPTSDSNDRAQEFAQRCQALESRLLEAQKADRDKAAKLGAVWDYAAKQAAADNYANAFEALDRLATAIDGILEATTKAPEGRGAVVSFAKSRLQWQAAKKEVETELARLRAAIISEYQQNEVKDAVKKLEEVLARFNDGLSDSLDDLYNAEANAKPPLAEKVQKIVDDYVQYVQSDALITYVEENPFEDVTVRATLLTPLTEIKSQLQTVL